MNSNLREYYAQRAREYERVYDKPERQAGLAVLRAMLAEAFAGHDVLEVACGTGYWTQPISVLRPSLAARSILATDVNREVVEVAQAKLYPRDNVRFVLADAYDLAGVPGDFTACFAGFWWSHVPRSALGRFLRNLYDRLGPGRLVVFVDNTYVEGSSHLITRRDDEGNTYQMRRLEDGCEYEVLKNFPTEGEIRECLSGMATNITFTNLTYFWYLSYTTD